MTIPLYFHAGSPWSQAPDHELKFTILANIFCFLNLHYLSCTHACFRDLRLLLITHNQSDHENRGLPRLLYLCTLALYICFVHRFCHSLLRQICTYPNQLRSVYTFSFLHRLSFANTLFSLTPQRLLFAHISSIFFLVSCCFQRTRINICNCIHRRGYISCQESVIPGHTQCFNSMKNIGKKVHAWVVYFSSSTYSQSWSALFTFIVGLIDSEYT